MKLKNRVVMSAIGAHESVESEGRKSIIDKLIAYHVARAKGGNGLNTVEVAAVDKASAPFGFLFIAEDKYTNGLKKLNDVELIEKSESIENESLKEQKNIIRELMDKKEREINGGLTNKEMRKKLLKEAEENKQEKRIAIASTIIDMIKTFRMRGNKKKAFWQYSDSAEVREMLKDSKYIPNNFFWDKLKEQFVFYYQTNVIGDNSEELNKKLADFEKAKEKFELDLSIIETEKMEEVEIIKKQYK